LRDAGHDILATPGLGGGVRVARDTRPRAVHFEVEEIIGLALSLAILRATPSMPFAKSADAALDRARMALSAARRRALVELERRVFVGAPSSARVAQTVGEVDDTVLVVFERCFTGSRAMSFAYQSGDGARSTRRIECVALVLNPPTWYVVAWDLDKDAKRLFRLDRMSSPTAGAELAVTHALDAVVPEIDPHDQWQRRPIG